MASASRSQRHAEPARSLIKAARDLCRAVRPLRFAPPVNCVYNPLEYARASYELYIEKYHAARKEVVFLGMNPGPFGMAQTGVPFGEIAAVRDWMRITARVGRPAQEHPKRPVQGFACERSEVSGQRLWGLFARRFGTAEGFFARHAVANYCPLVFMSESGANITPDKLPAAERAALFAACDAHLERLVEILAPRFVIGIGKFAERRAREVFAGASPADGSAAGPPTILTILHPSPASPAANKDWAGTATRQLTLAGVWP